MNLLLMNSYVYVKSLEVRVESVRHANLTGRGNVGVFMLFLLQNFRKAVCDLSQTYTSSVI